MNYIIKNQIKMVLPSTAEKHQYVLIFTSTFRTMNNLVILRNKYLYLGGEYKG